MCKLCWTISGVLLIGLALVSYKFIFTGAVAPSTDGRMALLLDEPERDLVLGEMRMFLSSVQRITTSIAK